VCARRRRITKEAGMRLIVPLVVVLVFGALLILDTAAVARLTVLCVTGGCGVRPVWIAAGAGVLALALLVSLRRSGAHATASKKGPARTPPARARSGRKPKKAKPRTAAISRRKPVAN
jgi:hypothetical protein